MTRWSAMAMVALAGVLSGCASGPDEPKKPLIADEGSSTSASTSTSSSSASNASADDKRRFRDALGAIESGDLEKAETELVSLTQDSPGLAAAHNNLGVIYRRTGRFDEARQQYESALQADSSNRDAHLNLGILYDIYLRQPAKALEHYQRYQELGNEPDEEVALWITDLERRL